ncbi:MAG: DUF357 domain-containing protein [Candidatus Thermoplasmatota archaeon]|nr:DUF357 domain-containing protein [Candidatus Thermoplasmatota archaeon]
MKNDRITEEKISRYTRMTAAALQKISIAIPEQGSLRKNADDFLRMATNYFNDSKHFYSKGDLVNAFACINYAYGWIDAGARLGFFNVGADSVMFTLSV